MSYNIILDSAVNTGDGGGMTKYIIIGCVCVVAIIIIAVLGIMSTNDK